jgi:Putative Ig domain
MSCRRARFSVVCLVLMMAATGNMRAQAPLTITTTSLPSTTVGSNVHITIGVTGGVQPLRWRLSGGVLPDGIKLEAAKGVLSGMPTKPGTFTFELTVTDSGVPAMEIHRDFKLVVTAALSIEWKQPPAVHEQKIDGSVVVSNLTSQNFTLTVIIMAVNQIGRATALGYQEFTLRSGAEQVIPFGASPGPGSYVVHADAVAEVPSANAIYRARKQTGDPLVIQPPN